MDVSIYSDAHLGIGEHARKVEDAGFSHLWIYDSPLVFGEPYLAMLQGLQATSRIVVGPGVTHPGSRPAVATAQALATLAKAAPGRVIFGAGTGSSARHSLGLPPATLDELASYVDIVRALLAADEAMYPEGQHTHAIRFIHPHGRWLDLSHPIETWVSAFGPRGQQRAATIADGIMVRWEGPDRLRRVRKLIHEAATAAGRDPADIKLGVIYALYPIEDTSELDGEEARAALGPLVISRLRYLTNTFRTADEVPSQFRRAFTEYRRYRDTLDPRSRHTDNYLGYLTHTPPELERFVDAESMATVSHVGPCEDIRAELDLMADSGADQASLQIAGSPPTWLRRMAKILATAEQ